MDKFNPGSTRNGIDLGFNFYDGNLNLDSKKAQVKKWEMMFASLKLKPGDAVIDIGCGYGDWLNYLRSKGLKVMGINMSPDQTMEARKRFNLDIRCCDWKDILNNQALQNELYSKFDAVTFMDCIEHFVPIEHYKNKNKQAEIYTNMFNLANKLIAKQTTSGRVFISCIHITKESKTIREYLSIYLLDRTYSGCYPKNNDGLTQYAKKYFNEISRYDRTEDYRLTSVLDRNHFGAAKLNFGLKEICYIPVFLLIDPHFIHKIINRLTDNWMWYHFGRHAWDCKYNNEFQKQFSHVTLWWIVLEKIPN